MDDDMCALVRMLGRSAISEGAQKISTPAELEKMLSLFDLEFKRKKTLLGQQERGTPMWRGLMCDVIYMWAFMTYGCSDDDHVQGSFEDRLMHLWDELEKGGGVFDIVEYEIKCSKMASPQWDGIL